MRKTLLSTAVLVAVAALAPVAAADEYDFVGYKYSQETRRDYDRGFFFGGEGWYVVPKSLNFDPVISSSGLAVGGVFLDLDWDYQLSGRYEIGYRANRRIGTFMLRYWDFSESDFREELGNGVFHATDTHPLRGDVTTDSFLATIDMDIEHAQAQWRKDFGWGRKFAGYWVAGLDAWEIEYQTDSFHFDAGFIGDAVHVQNFSSVKGYGGTAGVGGRYWFNDRFAVGVEGLIGYSSTVIDSFYLDENVATGSTIAFLERDDEDYTTLQYEGTLDFRLRLGVGFELDWGYRYLRYDDTIAKDRFVNGPTGKFVTQNELVPLSFEGPFLGLRYVIGAAKIDSDGDGVLDVYDDCPDTPAGAWVDEKGCPRDLDEDGVYDGIDRCPGTNFGSRVDEWGCSIDSDGDGVSDGLDLCPNTPSCAVVDGRGCPLDGDSDGVADGCDACPGTAPGSAVDARGCGQAADGDSDGDTVPDSRDRCPDSARGAVVDQFGCEQVIEMRLHFETDSDRINPADQDLLNRIAEALIADGGTFEVGGHADARGSVEYNQDLSERRAGSVRQYLIDRGVPASSLVAVGYSELRPEASNDTEEGMAINRRVEITRR